MSERKYFNLMSERFIPFSIDRPPSPNPLNSSSNHKYHGKSQRLILNGLSNLRTTNNSRRRSPEKKILTPEILSSSTLSSPWKGIPRTRSKERNGQKFSFSRAISTIDDLMSSYSNLKQLNDEQSEQSRKSTTESNKDFNIMKLEEDIMQNNID
uniref:Uncharacterized protein n=1 Tax=Panagrolaimus sp. JU765 TaxID=591449 RepID=A0AC34RLY8_9BILA